jgi:hypothetical protein
MSRPTRFRSCNAFRRYGSTLPAICILLVSCAEHEEKKTPSQIIDENSTILRQLGSYVDAEQRQGVARIRKLGRDQGTAVALYVLADQSLDDYRVEVVLARILADWREPRAIPYLLQCINLQDEGASRIAAEGLVAFGDEPRVIDALAELLSLPSTHDRQIAASVLQRISSNRVLDLFMERYKAETERDIRGIFVVKLISSRHPKRSAFLVEALADPDEGIRALAWQALQKSPALPKVAFAAAGPMENRAKDVAALRIWVRDRGGKAQLAP